MSYKSTISLCFLSSRSWYWSCIFLAVSAPDFLLERPRLLFFSSSSSSSSCFFSSGFASGSYRNKKDQAPSGSRLLSPAVRNIILKSNIPFQGIRICMQFVMWRNLSNLNITQTLQDLNLLQKLYFLLKIM